MTEAELLLAYADGELAADEVERAEALMATDPQARRQVDMYRETGALLRAACAEGFYAADADRLLPRPRVPAVRRRVALRWAAAACVAAVGLGYAGGTLPPALLHRNDDADSWMDEVAEYHEVFQNETTRLVEVPASHTGELASWLGERLGTRIEPPDLGPGLHFAGGRMLVIDGKPVADLLYTRPDAKPVAFCVLRNNTGPAPLHVVTHGAFRLATWSTATHIYVLIGEMTAAQAGEAGRRAYLQIQS